MDIAERIEASLDAIERDEHVRILLAVESGSRAWGFPSADSDFDVRFVYVHTRDWYLSIDDDRRDVIERPIIDDLDVNGWDLRKALRLFRKSNPPLLEWLQSPIVYRERLDFRRRMRALFESTFSAVSSYHHYLHMARGNVREYLVGDEVWRKKYFYVLRPLLAVRWLEAGRGPVPTEFGVLVDAMVDDPALRRAIDALVEEKKRGAELARGPRIPEIGDFIDAELARLESAGLAPAASRSSPELDELFRTLLGEAWRAEQARPLR